MKRNVVMLTFDLEEFDIAEEYGQSIPMDEQLDVTFAGMRRLEALLDQHQVVATFFTTGQIALKYPDLVRKLSEKHEIASHALFHSPYHQFTDADVLKSKEILESVTLKTIAGFRMPRLKTFDQSKLSDWAFQYDSSINPTYIPGRYNSLKQNPEPALKNGLIILPCSTTKFLRFPLFWLSFKNLPRSWYVFLAKRTLRSRNNLMLYFHPWEFADISGYRLPNYIKEPNGDKLIQKLSYLIVELRKIGSEFLTCKDFCTQLRQSESALESNKCKTRKV